MRTNKRKGISLIVLIITIVVIIILATAIIVSLTNANIIKNANMAKFKQDIVTYKDELNMYISKEYTNRLGKYDPNLLDADKVGIYYNNEIQAGTVLDIISIKGTKYEDMLYVEDGKLVLDDSKATEDEINWASSIGISSNTKVLVLSILDRNSIKVELNSTYKSESTNFTYAIYELDESDNKILVETKENVTDSDVTFNDLVEEKKYEIVVTLNYNDGTTEEFKNTIYLELNVGTIENWDYTLDTTNQTVKLVSYNGNEKDVTIYGNYEIDGIVYKTTLESNYYDQESLAFVQENYMFENNTTLESVKFKEGIDTNDVVGIANMFYGCTSLTSIDIDNLELVNKSSMRGIFASCTSLISVDLTGFDTSNITDMRELFSGCSALKSVKLTDIDTSSVTDMCGMFYYCTSLESVDLSDLDTSNVTDMRNLFNGCSTLKSVDLTGIDTSNVIKMNWMFFKCSALESVDVSEFITTNAEEMEAMFAYCSSLKTLDLRNFDTSNATNMAYMMEFCSKLESVSVTQGKWITSQAVTTRILADSGVSTVTYY